MIFYHDIITTKFSVIEINVKENNPESYQNKEHTEYPQYIENVYVTSVIEASKMYTSNGQQVDSNDIINSIQLLFEQDLIIF